MARSWRLPAVPSARRPDLLCVAWVGFDDNHELGLAGGDSVGLIWAEFMKRAVTRSGYRRSGEFPVPEGIEIARVDARTGGLENGCPDAVEEFFIAGTAPTQHCPSHGNLRWADLSPFRWFGFQARANGQSRFPIGSAADSDLPPELLKAEPQDIPIATIPEQSADPVDGTKPGKGPFRRFLGLFRKGS
jgi:hypothetical protein